MNEGFWPSPVASQVHGILAKAVGSLLVERPSTSATDAPVPLSDAAWVQRLQQGHPDALDELMARYSAALFAFLCRRVRSRETAEDLFQETWLRLVERCGTYRGDAPLKSWLYRIALNVIANHFRHENAQRRGGEHQQVVLEDEAWVNAAAVAPAARDAVIAIQERGTLHHAVEQLPEPFREVVRLRYFEELTTLEVAQVLGCAEGTVKSRLARGLGMLQKSPVVQEGFAR